MGGGGGGWSRGIPIFSLSMTMSFNRYPGAESNNP